jgi:hypothetical protein
MKFVYFRLFLSEVAATPSLFPSERELSGLSRSDFLKVVFSKRINFEHRKGQFVFVPIIKDADEDSDYIFGKIGRQYKIFDNKGPDENLDDGEELRWIASHFILNTSSDPDGQKIVSQDRIKVGQPLSYINSLIQQLNLQSAITGWHLSVNPIVEKSSFWKVVKENKGKITRAEFRYITPNVLGLTSVLNKRLVQYRENQNAQEVAVTLSEPKGDLILETQEVEDAIEYISEGGGSAKLSSGRTTLFDSSKSAKTQVTEVNDDARFRTRDGRSELVSRVFGDE